MAFLSSSLLVCCFTASTTSCVVKKTVGEDGKIFGSVTTQDVVDAVKQQTSKELDKKAMTVPDISEVGTYEVTVKLHPEVTGKFNLEVQKA